jgi:hypothetical protein
MMLVRRFAEEPRIIVMRLNSEVLTHFLAWIGTYDEFAAPQKVSIHFRT